MMNIKNKIKLGLSTGLRSLKIIKKNPGQIFVTVMFDALTLAFLFMLNWIVAVSSPVYTGMSEFAAISSAIVLFVLLIGGAIAIYSLFKMFIVAAIKRIGDKEVNSLDGFSKFFVLNLFNFGAIFIVLTFINIVLDFSLKESGVIYIMMFVFVLTGLFYYPFLNFQHFMFNSGKKKKDIMKNAYMFMKKRPSSYLKIYFSNAVVLLIYSVIYYIVGRIVISKLGPTAFFVTTVDKYNVVFSIISGIILYLLVVINRVQFWVALEQWKKE